MELSDASEKNPRIDPGTLRLVAQCLNHYATPGPYIYIYIYIYIYSYVFTGYTQKTGAVSKVNKTFISYLTRAQRTPSAAATVQVSHALLAVRFSCLLRGSGASFQDGVAAGKCLLFAPF